ncbi:solute carrier family 23 protein [Micromonospora sp. B11E3]|uniref:uracil-xanthine permease family protein n=1 Tax=Micromonospora sp. B11E3 TaxID=3153562 RepID=UPI00325C7114
MQHVVAMFGATFTVPLITGFPPATTLLFSGIGTLLFLLITRNRLPSYLGSSFAFIAPVLAAKAGGDIGPALGGIVVAGAALALVGLVVTLLAILLATVVFRGFLARLSILLGVVVGWLLAAVLGQLDPKAVDGLREAAWVGLPQFHAPQFGLRAVVLVVPVILVLIAENAGHVKAVAAMTGRNLDRDMGRAFLGDGLATVLAGSGGGSGTTTYAENIGVMAATRVYSTAAYWVAGAAAVLLGLSPKFGALILTVPAGVLGGATTALYGLIAILGARIWIENRVDFHDPVNLLTAAVALIVGAANYTLTAGDLSFNGIALGTAAALVIYHGMRLVARLRGTSPESRRGPEPEL